MPTHCGSRIRTDTSVPGAATSGAKLEKTILPFKPSTAPAAQVVEDLTGRGERLDPVDVGGATWEQYRDGDGSLSLVRAYGAVTVVVGTLRATAPLSELRVLAGSLTVA